MNPEQTNRIWPWIAGGCALLLVFACASALIFGAAGVGFVNWVTQRARTEPPMNAQSLEQIEQSLPQPPAARLEAVQGWVEVSDAAGGWAAAVEGQAVAAGQRIRTGALSGARLVFPDGSRAQIAADADITLDEMEVGGPGEPRTILMTQAGGESAHEVAPSEHPGSRYEVRTPGGSGAAKGTAFQVIVTPDQAAYFYVTEGVVAVTAVETTVLVNPGFMTVVYVDMPPVKPVQAVYAEGLVSEAGSRWTVAGVAFAAGESTTVSGDPQVGDWAAVKGHVDENGQNVADWVILLRRAAANRFSLTGAVEAVDETGLTVNGQAILIGEETEVDAGIAVGDRVYVAGVIETGGGLLAERVERLDADEGRPFAFTGVVQTIDGGRWEISGVAIITGEDTAIDDGIAPGDLALVKGRITAEGDWLAEAITLAGETANRFRFTGKLESIDPWQAAGIAFEVTEDAVIDDGLAVGDLVRVEGAIDENGTWTADRVERIDAAAAKMVIIGAVLSVDPWVVNGVALTVAPDAVIEEGVAVGMLVRVELELQEDGAWLAVRIEPLDDMPWFPGCMDVVVTVIGVEGGMLHIRDWPAVPLAEDATVEGALTPNSVVRMRICFTAEMTIQVTYIIIIEPGEVEPPAAEDLGGKVTVCHKPGGKKGGHEITISRAALPTHLGHGDYVGSCR